MITHDRFPRYFEANRGIHTRTRRDPRSTRAENSLVADSKSFLPSHLSNISSRVCTFLSRTLISLIAARQSVFGDARCAALRDVHTSDAVPHRLFRGKRETKFVCSKFSRIKNETFYYRSMLNILRSRRRKILDTIGIASCRKGAISFVRNGTLEMSSF